MSISICLDTRQIDQICDKMPRQCKSIK